MARNLIVALCLSVALVSCKHSSHSGGQSELVVRVEQVVNGCEQGTREFSFISRPFRVSELSFRVGGPISRFEVYPGNFYKQGAVIAEIDPRDFRIRKERCEAVYQQAKAEYERIEVLYEKHNISASTYEKAKADYISAKTAFEIAVNELEDTRLLAPFDGYIGEVYIERFQEVKALQPVISYIDVNRLKIETYVTQEIAFSGFEHRQVQLQFDALPDKRYEAEVVEISKSTTSNNLSYLLTAVMQNPDAQFPAGMSGKLFIPMTINREQPSLVIPQKAICHRPTEGDYVWVVDPSTGCVSRKKIALGKLMPEGKATVIDGLTAHETVVVSGLRFLSEGMKVQIACENRGC